MTKERGLDGPPETTTRGSTLSIIAIDTETTSLRPDRRAWEVGLIVPRESGDGFVLGSRAEVEPGRFRWFIDREELDLGNADPFSLKIGGLYERHPQFGGADATGHASPEAQVLREVERLTRGAHLLGALPSFDAEVLGARMRAHGIAPSWHYHTIDIEPLAIGYLHGIGKGAGWDLPWQSDDLSRAVGVEPPSDEDRHTALGDAAWALRLYEAITGRAS